MSKIHMGLPLVLERVALPTIRNMAGSMALETIRWTKEMNRFTEIGPLPTRPNDLFELMATHQVSHLRGHPIAHKSGLYADMSGEFPKMRDELSERGFGDETGLFTLFCLVPVGIAYHVRVQDPPRSWEDLAHPRWRGSIATFDLDVIYTLLRVGMRQMMGDRADPFVESILYAGTPANVNHAVDTGRVDVAVMPLPFGRASRQGNVRFHWPEDGAFVVPNVLLYKQQADERAIDVGRFLLSDRTQGMMAALGLIPVAPTAPMPLEALEHDLRLRWEGWQPFLHALTEDKKKQEDAVI